MIWESGAKQSGGKDVLTPWPDEEKPWRGLNWEGHVKGRRPMQDFPWP